MEHKMITFENEVFGKVRTLTIDSYPWFVAADVCKALEIRNPTDAIRRLFSTGVSLSFSISSPAKACAG